MTLTGAFFLFSTFIFTDSHIINFTGTGSNYKHNAGAMIILFASIVSVLTNISISLFIGKGKLPHKNLVTGVLSGGIMVGVLAGEIQNIGAAAIIGFFSGIISAVYMSVVYPRINGKNMIDQQGMIGPVLGAAFFGSFVIPASIIIAYYNSETLLNFLSLKAEGDWGSAKFMLIHFIVTLVLGLITGVIGGLITKFTNNSETDFTHVKFFIADYGLYSEDQRASTKY